MIGRPAGCVGDHGWSPVEIDPDNERRAIVLVVAKNERRSQRGLSIGPRAIRTKR